jgi:spore maturation protein CgeB
MKFLYIGQYSEGTTSKMRADLLKRILPGSDFKIIDTHIPFYATPSWSRSLGFRYKKGPLIRRVNRYILENIGKEVYDFIWVDKAVFITGETTGILRQHAAKLVHFTPDPAFTFHQSSHFVKSLPLYDYAVTSKSYELARYREILGEEKVLITTQGFDKELHRSCHFFNEKKTAVSFVGHWEKERQEIMEALLDSGIKVVLAGRGWQKFCRRNATNDLLDYRGEGIYGTEYARLLSEYSFSLGLLSKWVKEKHTTRTFEIPACGAALITERNEETSRFFGDDEVIFYDTIPELIQKIKYYMAHPDELEVLSSKGHSRVIQDGYDYESLLRGLLGKMGCSEK